MTDEPTDIAAQLQRSLRTLFLATVVLYLLVAVTLGAAFYVGWNAQRSLHLEETRTTRSLCAFRTDLVQRVRASVDFLVAHPNGIAGISAETIRMGIVNQQRTIDALRSLQCA